MLKSIVFSSAPELTLKYETILKVFKTKKEHQNSLLQPLHQQLLLRAFISGLLYSYSNNWSGRQISSATEHLQLSTSNLSRLICLAQNSRQVEEMC